MGLLVQLPLVLHELPDLRPRAVRRREVKILLLLPLQVHLLVHEQREPAAHRADPAEPRPQAHVRLLPRGPQGRRARGHIRRHRGLPRRRALQAEEREASPRRGHAPEQARPRRVARAHTAPAASRGAWAAGPCGVGRPAADEAGARTRARPGAPPSPSAPRRAWGRRLGFVDGPGARRRGRGGWGARGGAREGRLGAAEAGARLGRGGAAWRAVWGREADPPG